MNKYIVFLVIGVIVLGTLSATIYDALTWAEKSTVKGIVHKGAAYWYLENYPFTILNASVEGLPINLQQEGIKVKCKFIRRETNAGGFDYHLIVSECS